MPKADNVVNPDTIHATPRRIDDGTEREAKLGTVAMTAGRSMTTDATAQ